MNGFLNILKPPGMTSAGVVAAVRRMTGEKRVGHAGTLDPEAAGVLPVMIGRAARLFDYLVDKEKTYVAEVAFGVATDTQDATGRVVATGTAYPTCGQVEDAARRLTGDIRQKPSAYSAIKRDGKPLYQLARRGEEVDVPERLVHVERIDLLGEQPEHGWRMVVCCGRGTYIRTLCHDMGELVGCPAHMRFLLRSQTGAFDLSTAMTLEEAWALAEAGILAQRLTPLDGPLGHLPRVDAPTWLAKGIRAGAKLPAARLSGVRELAEGQPCRVYLEGTFWGIAARERDELVWRAQMPPDAP